MNTKDELAALYGLGKRITASLSLEEVVLGALQEIYHAVAPDLILLYLLHQDRVVLHGSWPELDCFKNVGYETKLLGECLCGLAGTGVTLYSKDIHCDPNCTLNDCKQAGIRSIAAIPLSCYDEVLGVLTVLSLPERDFSQQRSFLETIASQVAIALQNALLYKKEQDRGLELERIIAVQRQGEKKLQEIGTYYRKLLDTMNDGLAVADADGMITFVNRRFCEMFGAEAKDLVGRKFVDLLDKTNRTRWQEHHTARKQGAATIYELEILRNDGDTVCCLVSGAPLVDENGRFSGSIGVLTDITTLRETRQELARSNLIFKLLADYNATIATLEVEAIVDMTLAFLRDKVGLRESSVALLSATGDSIYLKASTHSKEPGLSDGLLIPLTATVLSEVIKGREPRYRPDLAAENSDYEIDRQLMKLGFKSDFLVPLWLENKCLGTLNIAAKEVDGLTRMQQQLVSLLAPRLVQAMKNAQLFDSLQQNEEKYKQLVENSPDIVYTFSDKRGGIYYSSRVESVFGYPVAHFYANPFLWHDSIHPEDLKKIDKTINNLANNAKFEIEYRIKDADGNWRWFRDRSIAVNVTADETVISGLATDITEHKTLQSQLQQAQKLEAIGTLASGITHDFNNILSVIFGYAELSKLQVQDHRSELYQNLDHVYQAAMRAKNLIRQILAFSRRSEQVKGPVRLTAVVNEALRLLRPTIPTTIDIQHEIASQSMVLADPTQIHQVVMNLCTNAYHAMLESGGTLRVVLKDATFTTNMPCIGTIMPAGNYIQLEVSDSGSGMDEETVARIFDPYFTTKAPGVGSGLGLAMVHGIVRSHQGHIRVASSPGLGTTFYLYFPVIEAKENIRPLPDTLEELKGGNESILFVDDEKAITSMAKRVLSKFGYRVTVRENGIQALEDVKQNPGKYDLIITDMTMPVMTGAELSRQILAIRPEMPVILCTGHSELISREKALAMGIAQYCEKPMDINKLLRTVREVFDQKRAAQEDHGPDSLK